MTAFLEYLVLRKYSVIALLLKISNSWLDARRCWFSSMVISSISKLNLACNRSVPCRPQRLTAYMECSTSTGLVSWEAGQGVLSYLVRAVGADGFQTQCSSTNTSCSLPGLRCGQLYNLTSVGQDGRCNSSAALVTLQSGTQLQSFPESPKYLHGK